MKLVLTFVGLFALAATATAVPDGDHAAFRSSNVKLTHELARNATDYRDLNAMAALKGIDYPVLLERSLEKDRAAIFLLAWLAANADFDGAALEGYSYTMVRAARLIGDALIADAATKLDARSRSALMSAFEFEFGSDNDKGSAVRRIRQEFPKLCSAIGETKVKASAQPNTKPK